MAPVWAIEVGAQGGHPRAGFLVQGSPVHAVNPPVANKHAPVEQVVKTAYIKFEP